MKVPLARKGRRPVQFYVGNGNRFSRSNYLTEKAFLHDLRTLKGRGVDVRVVYDDGTEDGTSRPPRKVER